MPDDEFDFFHKVIYVDSIVVLTPTIGVVGIMLSILYGSALYLRNKKPDSATGKHIRPLCIAIAFFLAILQSLNSITTAFAAILAKTQGDRVFKPKDETVDIGPIPIVEAILFGFFWIWWLLLLWIFDRPRIEDFERLERTGFRRATAHVRRWKKPLMRWARVWPGYYRYRVLLSVFIYVSTFLLGCK